MTKIGIDLGKKRSAVCEMDEPQKVTRTWTLPTTRAELRRAFKTRECCEVAIESCRDSGWVYEELKALGHVVVVVDTSRARAVGIGQGRRKNDWRDAEALARGLWAGVLPRAHVLSERGAKLRDVLHARDKLVRQRSQLVVQLRGQAQARGLALPRCAADKFAQRVREPETCREWAAQVHVQALLAVLDVLGEQIERLEGELAEMAKTQPGFAELVTVPGIKLVTALWFISAVDDPKRFRHAREVPAYLGLVPSESTTGLGKPQRGHITKCGNGAARTALVRAAWSYLRARRTLGDPLRTWTEQLGGRRGKKVAVVGLARRLSRILWAMWRDGKPYAARPLAEASARGLQGRARQAAQDALEMRVEAGWAGREDTQPNAARA